MEILAMWILVASMAAYFKALNLMHEALMPKPRKLTLKEKLCKLIGM